MRGGSADQVQDGNVSPHFLIMQESLSQLITDVKALQSRCANLEVANAKLKDEVYSLGQICSGSAGAGAVPVSLTCYASSSSDLSSTGTHAGLQWMALNV